MRPLGRKWSSSLLLAKSVTQQAGQFSKGLGVRRIKQNVYENKLPSSVNSKDEQQVQEQQPGAEAGLARISRNSLGRRTGNTLLPKAWESESTCSVVSNSL